MRIRLIVDYPVGGRELYAGDEIDVPECIADAMVECNIAMKMTENNGARIYDLKISDRMEMSDV